MSEETVRLRDALRYFAACMKGNFYPLEGRGEREMVSADMVRGIARSALGMCATCGDSGTIYKTVDPNKAEEPWPSAPAGLSYRDVCPDCQAER